MLSQKFVPVAMLFSLLVLFASQVVAAPLKSIKFTVPDNPSDKIAILAGQLETCKTTLQAPVSKISGADRLNPEIAEGYSAFGWEMVNFSGLGEVNAKTTKDNTILMVPRDQLKTVTKMTAAGLTHVFRCGAGDVFCVVLDNKVLNIK